MVLQRLILSQRKSREKGCSEIFFEPFPQECPLKIVVSFPLMWMSHLESCIPQNKRMVRSPGFFQFKSSIHLQTRSEILQKKVILFSDLRLFTTVVVTEIVMSTACSWRQIVRNLAFGCTGLGLLSSVINPWIISVALFTVIFSHLHNNVIQCGCEAISG